MWNIAQCVESFHARAYATTPGAWSPEAQAKARDLCDAQMASWYDSLIANQAHQWLVHESELGLLMLVIATILFLTITFRAKIARRSKGLLIGALNHVIRLRRTPGPSDQRLTSLAHIVGQSPLRVPTGCQTPALRIHASEKSSRVIVG